MTEVELKEKMTRFGRKLRSYAKWDCTAGYYSTPAESAIEYAKQGMAEAINKEWRKPSLIWWTKHSKWIPLFTECLRRKSMNAKQKRRKDLLLWRHQQYDKITPKQLANSLSVESINDYELPYRFRKALTEFRRLRQDRRTAACRNLIESEHGC